MAEHPTSKSDRGFNYPDGSPCTVFQFQALWKVTSLSPEILQIAGTFLLLLCVSAVGDRRNARVPQAGLAPLYAGLAVLNIGLWDDGERTTGAGGCHGTSNFVDEYGYFAARLSDGVENLH